MSDTSQGPGWWLASDGKWYPPETWTGPPMPTAQPPSGVPPMPTAQPLSGVPPLALDPSQASGMPPGYPSPQGVPTGATKATNSMAVASLACACVGIIPFLFGIPCVLGIVFGFVARSQIRKTNGVQGGNGMALAGIIVGFSLIAIFVLIVILVVVFGTNTTCTNTTSYGGCSPY